jgi:Zn-dependent protease
MEQMSGWRIFSLRGVAVKLHVSLLLLVIYVVLVALAQFPSVIQASGVVAADLRGSAILWALVFAISLIASIFIHEFGHVLVAQAKGYPVHQVTLMMLGGVSHIEKMPEKPGDEFKVAIIGPLVSLGIGGMLFGIREISQSANIDFYCYWMGQTNLVLGVFNLLPAFPTDGGRVLRAALVSLQGPLHGTRSAVKVSHVFAWLLGVFGLLQFNFLLVILAIFIYAAAKSELLVLVARITLKGLKVREVTNLTIPAVSAKASVLEAITQMSRFRSVILPVIGENEMYSVVTIDRVHRISPEQRTVVPISDIQFENIQALQATDDLEEAFLKLVRASVPALPVVENHMLIGLLKTADVLEFIQLRQLNMEEPVSRSWQIGMRQAH